MDQDNTAYVYYGTRRHLVTCYEPWVEHYNDMMESVKKRKEATSKIHPDNSSTALEPPRFYLFSQLPTELRLKVWLQVFRTPRIHISDLKNVRHSDIGSLMLVCRESRELGTSLRIPYYRLHPRIFHVLIPKQYFNPDIDTICFTKYDLVSNHVMLYDGQPIERSFNDSPRAQLEVNSVAIPASSWEYILQNPIFENDLYWAGVVPGGLHHLLHKLGNPQTLSLVVGDMDLSWCSNPCFKEPSDPPFKCTKLLGPPRNDLPAASVEYRIIPLTATWDTEARRVEDMLKWMKDAFIKCVDDRIKDNKIMSDWERNISKVEIPKVKFVEIVEGPVH